MYTGSVVVRCIVTRPVSRKPSVFQFLWSCQLPAPHFQQLDVSVDLQGVDTGQLLKPVLVLQAVDAVHRHLELFHVAINYHLKGRGTRHISACLGLKTFVSWTNRTHFLEERTVPKLCVTTGVMAVQAVSRLPCPHMHWAVNMLPQDGDPVPAKSPID